MTRAHERHTSAGPSAADRHRRADQKRKASYKIILEEVADKQKKLKTVVCNRLRRQIVPYILISSTAISRTESSQRLYVHSCWRSTIDESM